MISLKNKQKGFTIVELLIVIVVIGILVALVVTTFSGIQKKARDTERQTDIKAIHGQVEAYLAQKGVYPTLTEINDDAWVTANLKGLDLDSLEDPKGSGNNLQAAAAANIYSYDVLADDNTSCDNGASGDCTKYTLTATLEGGGTFVKTSLN